MVPGKDPKTGNWYRYFPTQIHEVISNFGNAGPRIVTLFGCDTMNSTNGWAFHLDGYTNGPGTIKTYEILIGWTEFQIAYSAITFYIPRFFQLATTPIAPDQYPPVASIPPTLPGLYYLTNPPGYLFQMTLLSGIGQPLSHLDSMSIYPGP